MWSPCPPREPLLGRRTVRSHVGACRGTFFSKKLSLPTPSGKRMNVTGRPARCGNNTGATRP
jgi:hypothetical protein